MKGEAVPADALDVERHGWLFKICITPEQAGPAKKCPGPGVVGRGEAEEEFCEEVLTQELMVVFAAPAYASWAYTRNTSGPRDSSATRESQKTLAESGRLVIPSILNLSDHEAPMATNLMTKAKAESAFSKKAAVPKKVDVVTLKSVFEQIGESHDLAKKQAHGLAAGFVEALTTHLVKGDKIRMSGLGILEVKNRSARMGRNPGTGEAIEIAASKKVAFRPAKELKEAI
jgi:DNA-binding protein HU-beta